MKVSPDAFNGMGYEGAVPEAGNPDLEEAHVIADSILCALLIEMDCDLAVHAWEKIGKYCA